MIAFMKKIICIALLLFSATYAAAGTRGSTVQSCASAIDENLESMHRSYGMETVLNSNPYAYIDNRYYKNIVSLGFDAAEILLKKNADGGLSSLDSYICAIAIQEITGCDLYGITGIDFETADEFYDLWDKTMSGMPKALAEIAESKSMTFWEKVSGLKKYGIFGEAAAYSISGSGTALLQFLGQPVSVSFTDTERNMMKSMVRSDLSELRKAADYLNKIK